MPRSRTATRWTGLAAAGPKEFYIERFAEAITLDQIASTVGVHPGHLAREFRRYYRCTPGDYIRQLRVDRACRELSVGDNSLAEVALAAGFSDQSHFATAFKRHTGLTPAAYRRAAQAR